MGVLKTVSTLAVTLNTATQAVGGLRTQLRSLDGISVKPNIEPRLRQPTRPPTDERPSVVPPSPESEAPRYSPLIPIEPRKDMTKSVSSGGGGGGDGSNSFKPVGNDGVFASTSSGPSEGGGSDRSNSFTVPEKKDCDLLDLLNRNIGVGNEIASAQTLSIVDAINQMATRMEGALQKSGGRDGSPAEPFGNTRNMRRAY